MSFHTKQTDTKKNTKNKEDTSSSSDEECNDTMSDTSGCSDEEEEMDEDDEEHMMNALKDAMKHTILFSIQVEEEDEDEDWEPEDEEDDEDDEEEEDNEKDDKTHDENEDNKQKTPQKEEQEDDKSRQKSKPQQEKTRKPKKDKPSPPTKSKTKPERRTQPARPSKSKARQTIKKELEKDTKKSKQEEKKSDKEEEEDKDTFDFETAMSEFKAMFDKKEGTPSLLKEHAEKLEMEYKKRQAKREKREKRKTLIRNSKEFRELLLKKRTESDLSFFRKLPVETQSKYIQEFRRLKDASSIKKPYTIKLLESPIPVEFKSVAFKKVAMLETMEPGFGEYFKVKQWVDTFMQIPFGINHTLPVSLEQDGVEKCHEIMRNAKETLDQSVYGLNDAKMQIMQMLGQLMTNPASVGTAIAIKGPMGTGKTTLVKHGISKVLGRPFVFIPLGGATDSSYLEGHSYTYEGSTWGRIVQSLVQCKCMNPVFYFDELDKVSDTPRGEEIIGILTHLTDTTQNTQYHDKYFADLDFDLSKALFIFSYNHEEKVNSILRDRMYCIETKGYEKKDKIIIARKYLIPHIIKNVKFTEDDISIPDTTIEALIDQHTDKEKGVRNLKRCLETIYTKLNLYRLMPEGSTLFEDTLPTPVRFPFTVDTDTVKRLLKKGEERQSFLSMYV